MPKPNMKNATPKLHPMQVPRMQIASPKDADCWLKHLWVEKRNNAAFRFLPEAGLSFAKQEQADIGAQQV